MWMCVCIYVYLYLYTLYLPVLNHTTISHKQILNFFAFIIETFCYLSLLPAFNELELMQEATVEGHHISNTGQQAKFFTCVSFDSSHCFELQQCFPKAGAF